MPAATERLAPHGEEFYATKSQAGPPDRVNHSTYLAVLGDLDLLDELAERGTITGPVLAANADLLGALAHGG